MTRTARLTRAQAHRLIETYGFIGPREPALTRLISLLCTHMDYAVIGERL